MSQYAYRTSGDRVPDDPDDLVTAICARIADAVGAAAQVNPDAALRDVGGTSVHAAVVLAGLWRDWDVRLALTDLTATSTARDVAAAIESSRQ
jgi:Phosphopantetheine attachment site